MIDAEEFWGADGVVSLPKPLERTDTEKVDFGGFCFTPSGLRVDMSEADQEEFLRQGFGPRRDGVDPHG